MPMELRSAALLLGGVVAAVGAALAAAPTAVRDWSARFPRMKPAAWMLTALDLLWSAWLVHQMPLEGFDNLKPLLYVITPATFVLVVMLLDDLLAPRALGGLLLLIPCPLLDVQRWHPSPWRAVVAVLAYAVAGMGFALVLNPYQFRKVMTIVTANDRRGRLLGALTGAAGTGVVILALTKY